MTVLDDKQQREQSAEFVLVIRATPAGKDKSGRDALYRLKGVLKVMRRRFGWKCVSLRPRGLDDDDKGTGLPSV